MSTSCGIDFGTSNSAIAHARNGKSRLLPLQDGAGTVPTALFFSLEDTGVAHGREAMSRYLAGEPGRLMRAIKSVLGSSLFDEMTQIRGKRYTFTEITADFLRFLRTGAARSLPAAPDHIVLGRPAYFVDDDPEADARAQDQLEAAARLAGFAHIEFQFEPIAAALHYESGVDAEELALVADIGGGTSDFSLVRVSPARAVKADRRDDILGYNGVHIGGTDFDRQLSMAALMPALGLRSPLRMKGMEAPSWYFADLSTWHRINVLYDPKVITEIKTVRRDSSRPELIERLLHVVTERLGHRLLGRVEQAKIDLSTAERIELDLSEIEAGLGVEATRRLLETAIADHLARIETRVRDLLELASVGGDAVRTVFLTGGTSGVPAVQDAIRRAVPQARHVRGDAFGSVAAGLALDAERRFGGN